MVADERSTIAGEAQGQVDRILRSEQFRTSEVLRRLLLYLTEKSLAGEADALKEYVVAIDGLGKPESYDPQHNSAVRIQVCRLRQRLTEYYREEGKHDPILVELPKGHFRLTFDYRSSTPVATEIHSQSGPRRPGPEAPIALAPVLWNRGRPAVAASVAVAVVMVFSVGLLVGRTTSSRKPLVTQASPELQQLWAPFLDTRTPLILSIEDPLFAEIRSSPGVYFRDRSMNDWSEMVKSAALNSLAGALRQSELRPSRYYTAFGEAESAFLLGGMLKGDGRVLSLVRTSQLSWQQIADNNVIFVGVQNLFFNQLRNMPMAPQLVPELNGVRDDNPAAGAPSMYLDQYTTAPSEEGTVFALATHVPGPNGKTDIESFTSNRSAGYLAAVQSFTDPQFAQELIARFKSAGGRMPRFYQVLLRIHYRDGVPTETKIELTRELH